MFSNRNGSGYAVVNRRPPPVNIVDRRPKIHTSNPNRESEEEVKVVWDKCGISQADPTPHLQNLSTEELVPRENALLKIVSGTIKPKKPKEIFSYQEHHLWTDKGTG